MVRHLSLCYVVDGWGLFASLVQKKKREGTCSTATYYWIEFERGSLHDRKRNMWGKGKRAKKKIQFHSIRIRKTSDKPPTMLFSSTSEDMIREHQLSPFIYICTDYGVYEADQWLEIGSKSLLALFPYGRVELSMFFCFVFRQKTCPHPLSTIWIRGKMELKEVQCLVLTHSHMSVWTYL